jgi:putative SOS response-associated peptidase YedK
MCYSAQIEAEHKRYERLFGVRISLSDYVKFFWEQREDLSLVMPKAVEANFLNPQTDDERQIKALIDEVAVLRSRTVQEDLFAQRARLAEAERKLQVKETKAAAESKRIALKKIEWRKAQLSDLQRTDLRKSDARIYPANYAPLMVVENGERLLMPMRFLCRPAGKPAFYDQKYPGTYNARRDNLEGFWRGQFGVTHGVLIASAFFENVKRHRAEGRELREGEEPENVVLEFKPNCQQEMYLACLWSRWTREGERDLLSFALVTDDPPPEVSAAGHDRCPIPLKAENVEAWLNPNPADLAASYAVLDDRERPFYEHRLAA